MTKPKFIQIVTAPDVVEDLIYALDEEGGVWFFDGDAWEPFSMERRAASEEEPE